MGVIRRTYVPKHIGARVGSPPYIRHITAYQGGDRAPPLPKPAKFPKGIYITIYDTTMERVIE